jgi:hypothetical protein
LFATVAARDRVERENTVITCCDVSRVLPQQTSGARVVQEKFLATIKMPVTRTLSKRFSRNFAALEATGRFS